MNKRVINAVDLLTRQGYVILENLADDEAMSRVAQELLPHFSRVDASSNLNHTKRIHSRVLAGATDLQDRLIDPVVLAVVDHLLGENCVKYQLSSVQGIEVHPGAGKQGLHRDDDIFRIPHPHPVFEVNVMWAVTDFTAENGATHVIPNSHDWPSGRTPCGETETQVEMKSGSALIWLGSTWHGAGANQTANPRMGVYAGYSLGWLRQEEIMYLALPPESVRLMPEVLQRLIGYELKGTSTLGWLDGKDPRTVLNLNSEYQQ